MDISAATSATATATGARATSATEEVAAATPIVAATAEVAAAVIGRLADHGGGGGAAPAELSAAVEGNRGPQNDESTVDNYIQALSQVTTKDELDRLKASYRDISQLITKRTSSILSTAQSIFFGVLGYTPYPWEEKGLQIVRLFAEKQKLVNIPLQAVANQQQSTFNRIAELKDQLESGINTIRINRDISPEEKERAIVRFLAESEGSINELKTLVGVAFTFSFIGGTFPDALFTNICDFGIKHLGVNMVTEPIATKNREDLEKFDEFTQWAFTNFIEFNKNNEENAMQGMFRESGSLLKVDNAFSKYQNEGFDALKTHIVDSKSKLPQDNAQDFRNNISGIIKKVLENALIGKVNIDVQSLPKFSTILFSIFLSVNLDVYRYDTISRGFPLTKVIFKEVKNEIDILLEEVKHEPVFMNFLTRFELSLETDKLNTSFVKWMLFAAADGDNEYLEEEKLFAERILDPGRFPAITTIRNCAKDF